MKLYYRSLFKYFSISPVRVNAIFIGLTLLCISACGGGNGNTTPSEPSDFVVDATGENIGGDGDLFAKSRLIEVDITMPHNEFEILRAEGRSLASTDRECIPDFEYTEFTASVKIDNDNIDKVIIRKKGFLGSLSNSKPSLKLNFGKLLKGQTYQNMKRMTLNNNRQDPSNSRQCLAYDMFDKVGLVAPRCNLARVTVNGELLGIYSNVEPIKKPFLENRYLDDSGNLYEAQIADFGQYLISKFEKKTNEKENDRSDLQMLADAMALTGEEFISEVSQLVDVDEFIQYWAMETLLGHWDSATGNANNFYIYRSPTDGLFHFIPWGADASFSPVHLFKPESGPLYRNFNLAAKLFQIDSYRDQYYSVLAGYLEDYWNEEEIKTELERVADLSATEDSKFDSINDFVFGRGDESDMDFIPSQRSVLEKAIAGLSSAGAEQLLTDVAPDCSEPLITNLSANASSENGVDMGSFSFTLTSGQVVNASVGLASLSVDSIVIADQNFTSPSVKSVTLIGVDINDNFKPYVLQVLIESPSFIEGTHSLHGFATNVVLFEVDESQPLGVSTLALGATGTIVITNVGSGDNAEDINMDIDATLEY